MAKVQGADVKKLITFLKENRINSSSLNNLFKIRKEKRSSNGKRLSNSEKCKRRKQRASMSNITEK